MREGYDDEKMADDKQVAAMNREFAAKRARESVLDGSPAIAAPCREYVAAIDRQAAGGKCAVQRGTRRSGGAAVQHGRRQARIRARRSKRSKVAGSACADLPAVPPQEKATEVPRCRS